jgi:hypothetical protein
MSPDLQLDNLKTLASLLTAAVTDADLRGKDYFTLEEACRYCGIGETAFRERVKLYNIPQGASLGTKNQSSERKTYGEAMECHSFESDERVKYWQLDWFGPDLDPATGKKARHQESLGRIDEVPEKLARERLKAVEARTLHGGERAQARPGR